MVQGQILKLYEFCSKLPPDRKYAPFAQPHKAKVHLLERDQNKEETIKQTMKQESGVIQKKNKGESYENKK